MPEVRSAVHHRADRPRRQDHAELYPRGVRLQTGDRAHGRGVKVMRGSTDAADGAVASFLEHLAAERGASPHTVRAYATDLREFTEFLRSQGATVKESDPSLVRAYLARLHQRRLARTSIGRRLASVRSCFRYLARHGVIERNPARQIRSPRQARRLPSFVPQADSTDR